MSLVGWFRCPLVVYQDLISLGFFLKKYSQLINSETSLT